MSEQDTETKTEAALQDKRTFVEDGTEFKGNLVSSCHVVVRGKVEGEVMAPKLTVTESGSVVGEVNAEHIQSEGVLAGTITAEELLLSGSVRDDTVIRAKRMEVKLSRADGKYEVTFGACTLEVGDDPRAELADAATVSDDKPRDAAQPTALEAKPASDGDSAEAKGDHRGKRKPKGKRDEQPAAEAAAEGQAAPATAESENASPKPTPSNAPPPM